MKIHVGDTVKVTAGKDKGKTGKVERSYPQKQSVLVAGVNIYKKHVKARNNRPGEIIQVTRPLPTGNVALICPKCNQPTRVGYSVGSDGKKVRICRKCKAPF
jgi:large subunit ribosomal protein L24